MSEFSDQVDGVECEKRERYPFLDAPTWAFQSEIMVMALIMIATEKGENEREERIDEPPRAVIHKH